jgi:hypothetical protein
MVSRTQENLAAALTTAGAGLHVFPARVYLNNRSGKWDKVPIAKGWQQGSSDEQQVRAWWREFPWALPGIALGRAGLLAIDPDRHGGPDGVAAWATLIAEHGGLPEHPTTITPSGGEHHLFRQPPDVVLGNGEGSLPEGINVRGRGGFIFAQGAVRPDGQGWQVARDSEPLAQAVKNETIPVIPEWLAEIIRTPKGRPIGAPPAPPPIITLGHAPTERERKYGADKVAYAIADFVAAKSNRNNALNIAALKIGSVVARGWVAAQPALNHLRQACVDTGYASDEPHKMERTIQSGFESGLAKPHADPPDRPYRKAS